MPILFRYNLPFQDNLSESASESESKYVGSGAPYEKG